MPNLSRYFASRRHRGQRVRPTFKTRIRNAASSLLGCFVCGADRNMDAVEPFRSPSAEANEAANVIPNVRPEIPGAENESVSVVRSFDSESSDFSPFSLPDSLDADSHADNRRVEDTALLSVSNEGKAC